MQIVTDSGVDISPEQLAKLDMDIHFVPLVVTLDGKSYREDVDIQPPEFYRLLAETDSLPTTSQPSAGDFAEVYRRLATTDPDMSGDHRPRHPVHSHVFGPERHSQFGQSRRQTGAGGRRHRR
jgi:hypothetical protein